MKKIASDKLFILYNDNYLDFENINLSWDKNKCKYKSTVPKYIIIRKNKELLTGEKINEFKTNASQEGLFFFKEDLENISFKELLWYLKDFKRSLYLMTYMSKIKKFAKINEGEKPFRTRKNN